MSTEIVIPRSSDWYKSLVEECHAIVVEKTKIAQQELTEMYLLLGERILEEAKHAPVTKIVEAISKDLRIGHSNVWYAVAVVKKYGSDVNDLPIEGASVSWNKAKALITPPTGVDAVSEFDPYAFSRIFFSKHDPADSRKVGEELLRLFRERK